MEIFFAKHAFSATYRLPMFVLLGVLTRVVGVPQTIIGAGMILAVCCLFVPTRYATWHIAVISPLMTLDVGFFVIWCDKGGFWFPGLFWLLVSVLAATAAQYVAETWAKRHRLAV